jgi:hypothetical protein
MNRPGPQLADVRLTDNEDHISFDEPDWVDTPKELTLKLGLSRRVLMDLGFRFQYIGPVGPTERWVRLPTNKE